jgi:hypothetical protein
MNEQLAGRLELTGARARRLLGGAASTDGSHESTANADSAPNEKDAKLLAARISSESSLEPAAADALAREIVARAQTALDRVLGGASSASLSEEEALALESVIHVRGRPALRVIDDRLEGLSRHPGSEFWQDFITDSEDSMIAAAAVTGAAFVSSFSSGFPPWIQGSAWLIAPNRVVTNRHVLMSSAQGINFVEPVGASKVRLREDYEITIDFTHDDRTSETRIRRPVISIVYLAKMDDPVDIAVLEIEPFEVVTPLCLFDPAAPPGNNFYVIGHPGAMTNPAAEIATVFTHLDGKKRVSFGKRFTLEDTGNDLVHDASTVGGYSGAPVVAISSGKVSGLHYYGDPVAGNLAVTAATIRAHEAYQYFPPVS